MMDIFTQFDAILSALTKEQYKPLYKAYHAKDEEPQYSSFSSDVLKAEDVTSLLEVMSKIENKAKENNDNEFSAAFRNYVIEDLQMWKNITNLPLLKEKIAEFINDYENTTHQPSRNRERYTNLFDAIEKGFSKTSPYRSNKDRIVIPITIRTSDSTADDNWVEMNECICIMGLAYLYFKYLYEHSSNESTRQKNYEEAKKTKELFDFCRQHQGKPSEFFSKFDNWMSTNMWEFRSQEGRKISVSKILKFVQEKYSEEEIRDYTIHSINSLLTNINKRIPDKELNLAIVISRHPYDIGGMSTDRGWTSCMNLETGQHKNYVESSITHGGLIAYLCYLDDTTKIKDSSGKIHSNDKINIQKPLGRVLIKPFYKSYKGKPNYNDPNFILMCSKVYGTFYTAALRKLQNWLNENWNSKVYQEDNDYVLSDSFYKELSDIESLSKLSKDLAHKS